MQNNETQQPHHVPIYGELHHAATVGDFENIKRLCTEQNINDTAGKQLFTLLHCAALENIKTEIVSYLLSIPGCDMNRKDFNGNTPLFVAALAGHEKLVKFFLLQGAEVEQALFDRHSVYFSKEKPKIFAALQNALQGKTVEKANNSSYGWNFWPSCSLLFWSDSSKKNVTPDKQMAEIKKNK